MQKTDRSLRTLTLDERNAIEVKIIRVVEADKNETLEELGKRTDNVVNTNITSIMNGIEEKAKLNEKQSLKIVLKEKYF